MESRRDIVSIILAAGEGTRMVTKLPKVLHKISAKPMINYILAKVRDLGIQTNIVVVGYKNNLVRDSLKSNWKVTFIEQKELLGTGHAVLQAEPVLKNHQGDILILCGDMPMLKVATLARLLGHHRHCQAAATLLTAEVDNPTGYGRILTWRRKITGIVEEKNATPAQKSIKEINTGAYCFRKQPLFWALKKVKLNKLKGEYYLTDVIGIMAKKGDKISKIKVENSWEALGVNSRAELQRVARIIKDKYEL